MPISTSDARAVGARAVWTRGLVMLFLAAGPLGCDDDIGRCCTTLRPGAEGRIPTATRTSGGQPTSDIAIDPDFDCDSLVCVAFEGAQAFCTDRCFDNDDCPDDFVCQPVLEADPPPDPNRQINQTDRFCVRQNHQCSD